MPDSSPFKVVIMGAAGRDFHDLRTFFRHRAEFRVCAITAAQIPFIDRRVFPKELAGPRYDADIPIHPEEELPELIARYDVDFVFLAYSDLSHAEVMHRASVVQAAGASFALLGPRHTELSSRLPVIAVTAVRTGAGKSPITLAIAQHLAARGVRVGTLRHPMPYGDLLRQAVQRFSTLADLDAAECTIEEREEYEPYVHAGLTIYAGVDYETIVARAEAESDVLLWDGGNNDTSFVRPGLSVVVLDALRPGHERAYYPGETNLRRADVLVINKADRAERGVVARMRADAARDNPRANILESRLAVTLEGSERAAGARVLVVEDGPTVTHGGMPHGAGMVAAQAAGVREIVDPRRFATGSIAAAFRAHPHIGAVLPALGYSEEQRAELAGVIARVAPDLVIDASPASLDRVLKVTAPIARVTYRFEQTAGPSLLSIVDAFLGESPLAVA